MANTLQGIWPLSAAQQGIWLGQQLYPHSPLYNTAECLEICGSLDVALFERSLRQMVTEAETLNLRFGSQEEPIQYLDASLPWSLQQLDLSTTVNPRQAAQAWMQQNLNQTVNLSTDRLFAQALIRIAPERYFWYQRLHHVAIDGYGTSLLVRRVAEIYTALSQGKAAPPCPFGRLQAVLEEDVAYQTSEQRLSDRAYWLASLADAPEPVSFSAQTAPASATCLRHSDTLSAETFKYLQRVAQELGRAWPDVLLAAIVAYLYRATGASDHTLGLPMMGRLGSAAIRVPAMVMNIVPLRVRVSPGVPFSRLVEQIGDQLRDSRPHHRYRYEQLRRDLRRVGGGRRLFGPVVNIMPFDYAIRFGNAPAIAHNVSAGPVEDLAINVRTQGQDLKLEVDGNPACYSLEDLVNHQQNWLTGLNATLEHPDQLIGPAPALISGPNGATDSVIKGEPLNAPVQFVLDRFIQQVQLQPQAEAVVDGDLSLSYSELLHYAQEIASRLVAAGVKPGQIVAIYLLRSRDAIAAILGILLSGAAYLALDPQSPPARNASLLQDARPTVLITTTAQEPQSIPELPPQIWLDRLDEFPTTASVSPPRDNALAYVVYTSGSTGNPKGVMVDHLALASFVAGALQRYGVQPGDRVLQFAAPHFDASVEEIFSALCSGATLVLREESMLQSIPGFLRACEKKQITVLDLPTAFWHELAFCLSHGQASLPNGLRMVIIGGEAAHPERVHQWHAAVGNRVTLLNTYGPSETTVVATAATLEPGAVQPGAVPIGRPLPGVEVAVLDGSGHPVAIDQPGELYVLGPTLARGYLGRSQLTTERFVSLESLLGRPRAYRTGDQVRLRQDGQLVFIGRLDAEFKISGHRVDLAELESVLAAIPGIREVAVVGYGLPEGIKRLGAYLVAKPPYPTIQSLRQHLAQAVPAAVIPAGFSFVEALPKTSSGKVDRAALCDRPPEWLTEPDLTAVSPLEALILRTWEDILGQRGLTVQDDFFELGGQSLQTIQLTSWLSTQLNCEIPIATIFRYPTAAQLAKALTSTVQINHEPWKTEGTSPEPHPSKPLFAPLLPITESDLPPLFCVHPAAGISWCYMGLARRLGSQHSLYGLQSPDLEAGVPAFIPAQESWAQLLDQYLALVRQVQPQGPYRLLGWSFGGMIAQAMATRLQQQGDEVARLILLDAYPSQQLKRRDRPDDAEVLALLLQATGQPLSGPLQDKEAVLKRLRQRQSGLQLDLPRLNTLLEITRRNIELARQAPVPEPYHGDLLFFTATRGRTDSTLTHAAWQPFVTGFIENYNLDAEHGQVLTGNGLSTVAQAIAAHLASP
ncbi:amino acid adenylation domain-containing protein [Nodosilinea sp. AN01ver1]|uniref:amino acid adenylation domain-containing protein n=1 Tax=Nodosilinea sp. AN01ver1 TaxID=3423362 RepID=UPI003D31AC74